MKQKEHKEKKHGKLIIIIPTILICCLVVYIVINAVFSPYWGSVYPPNGYFSLSSVNFAESDETVYTKEQAVEDLDYVIKCLNRDHPMFEDGVPDKVQKQIDTEKNSWGEEVGTYELWRSIARVLSSIGDAHTMTNTSFSRKYLYDYICKSDNGYTVTKINGTDVDELFQQNKDLFSYELESWGMEMFTDCLETREGLKFLNIDISSDIVFTYEDSDGKTVDCRYTAGDFYSYDDCSEMLGVESDDTPSYSYEIDEKSNVGVFTLTSCDYDSEYKEEIYNFFTEVIEKNIDNVVVDLRDNYGGNSGVADEFIMYLDYDTYKTPSGCWRLGPYTMHWDADEQNIKHYDEMLFGGNVYVLTSSNTFSAACDFATMISDNGFGAVVGEACGNMPASYGEAAVFQTPNSLMSFQVSTKYFGRIDESKADQPLIPDIECSSEEALNVVIDIISKQ